MEITRSWSKSATTNSEDHYLATITKSNEQMTAPIVRVFVTIAGTRITGYVNSAKLHNRGLYARKFKICVSLT